MRRTRGFTLVEATISLLILSVVMIVALTLLVSMRSFAAKQQSFTAPRQTARSAVDYLTFFAAGASDQNVEQGNPNALLMWASFGTSTAATLRQASFNNLTAAQATAGFGDEGTDIVTFAVPTSPVRMPIAAWDPADVAGTQMAVNYTAGCSTDDAANLASFRAATGARTIAGKEQSGLLTAQDDAGRWRYVQITDYVSSDCAAAGGTDEVIRVLVTPGQTAQLHPPGGWRGDLEEPFYLIGGIDFTSFRVRNRNLEQKTSGVDGSGRYSPGIFDPGCDGTVAAAGCPSIGFNPVVENVEDLQVAYVYLDGTIWNTAVQVLATAAPDGTASNVPEQGTTGTALGARDVAGVRALRISVIARSNPMDIGSRGLSADVSSGRFRRVALEDHPAGPPDTIAGGVFDRYRLTTTILLRNRMLGF